MNGREEQLKIQIALEIDLGVCNACGGSGEVCDTCRLPDGYDDHIADRIIQVIKGNLLGVEILETSEVVKRGHVASHSITVAEIEAAGIAGEGVDVFQELCIKKGKVHPNSLVIHKEHDVNSRAWTYYYVIPNIQREVAVSDKPHRVVQTYQVYSDPVSDVSRLVRKGKM